MILNKCLLWLKDSMSPEYKYDWGNSIFIKTIRQTPKPNIWGHIHHFCGKPQTPWCDS